MPYANLEKRRAHDRKWRNTHRQQYQEQRRATAKRIRERRYGLTPTEYEALLAFQGGVCAICKKPETRIIRGRITPLSVDHCHKTNRIRALLCHKHNTGIGFFNDNSTDLRAAANYLDGFSFA